jgi:hypothetical protein
VNRLPVSPLVLRGLEIAEKHLGMEELSKRLNTTPTIIEMWRFGHAEMPARDFLNLVDLLMDLDPGWMSPPKPGV